MPAYHDWQIGSTGLLMFRRHDLSDRNPIQWVRQSAKRRTAPDILTSSGVQQLFANLPFGERTLVLLAVTTGLRGSELFALKWGEVDFQSQTNSCDALDRAERHWRLQDGKFSETCSGSR